MSRLSTTARPSRTTTRSRNPGYPGRPGRRRRSEPARPPPPPPGHRGRRVLGWVTSTDHKVIGNLYLVTVFGFFMIGGLLAMIIRAELFAPGLQVVDNLEQFNQMFTMHGSIMLLLFATPFFAGFANAIMPLQIGAPDVAFPRLNMLAYWFYLFGGLMAVSVFLVPGGAASFGWFAYAPLSNATFTPGLGGDLWLVGLALSGFGTILGGVNFVTTIVCLRAPGMTMFRMPLFTWTVLITSIMVLMAFPVLTAAFFEIISEVLPVFSRKPLFGYKGLIFATIAIAALSMTVWAHHMYATGQVLLPFFAMMSMLIAVPTGVKFFNWVGTMWGGSLTFETPMVWALGFLTTFLFGGLTGIVLASPALDFHVTDTYFVVAHFHYTVFGTVVFAMFAGFYFWWPKLTGRMLDEKLGKVHFAMLFIGFHGTFLIQHVLGMQNMPRRYGDYLVEDGVTGLNQVSSMFAFLLGASTLVFLYNVWRSRSAPLVLDDDPWGYGSSLEWATSCPPPRHNFDQIPRIRSERPAFDLHHPEASAQETTQVDPDPHTLARLEESTGRETTGRGPTTRGAADRDPPVR
ncbi:cytochrome c oxidase subunit I [Agilicoccus flavus]|uniref:cytochrome c oxidase subunit I n=1 Tax=Agilicoccus flavus TaxID=2775968 RepID=UPI003FD7E491